MYNEGRSKTGWLAASRCMLWRCRDTAYYATARRGVSASGQRTSERATSKARYTHSSNFSKGGHAVLLVASCRALSGSLSRNLPLTAASTQRSRLHSNSHNKRNSAHRAIHYKNTTTYDFKTPHRGTTQYQGVPQVVRVLRREQCSTQTAVLYLYISPMETTAETRGWITKVRFPKN